MTGSNTGVKEVWVRARHDAAVGRTLWRHDHELLSPKAARRARKAQQEEEEDFVDYMHGTVPSNTRKCYLFYRFFENAEEGYSFHLSYEDAKKHFDAEAANVPFSDDEVRLTEESVEGHILCTSCMTNGSSYYLTGKTIAAVLRVIDLYEGTC